jgi:hypothetical protein
VSEELLHIYGNTRNFYEVPLMIETGNVNSVGDVVQCAGT